MNKNMSRKLLLETLGSVILGFVASGTLLAQPGPDIVHAEIECLPQTQFAILMASIQPGDEIQSARVYFRSDKYLDFYYVDMDRSGEEYQAILPKPSPETEQVIYYIEAVDVGFSSNRTAENISQVVEDEDECERRDPAAAYFTGGNPGIVVGALKLGLPPVPPGFLAEGIAGFVPLTSSGGGVGATTAIAVGAGAAGAAGVGVLVASSGDAPTTTTTAAVSPPPPPPTTTTVTTSVPTASAVRACYSTSPDPAVVEVGERIRLDARCSEPKGSLVFTWELGDGRKREGAFIEPSYSSPGTYTVVLTVRRTTSFGVIGQSTPDEDRARFQVIVKEPGADLSVKKTGTPEPYDPFNEEPLTYTITVENLGPGTASGVTVVDTLPPEMIALEYGGCIPSGGGRLTCQLGDLSSGESAEIIIRAVVNFQQEPELGPFVENTVEVTSETNDPNPGNNTATARNSLPWEQRTMSVDFASTSLLQFTQTDERSTGNVVLNGGRVDTTTSGAPFQHRFEGRPGNNTIEAYASAAGREGLWRFDFSGAQGFVAGSFRVESGQIASRDAYTVVFRMSGTAGERIRFSFELAAR